MLLVSENSQKSEIILRLVYLALAVLFAVFCISFAILVIMCRRRYEYNRLLISHSARFSKLKHNEMDSVEHLSPHMGKYSYNLQYLLSLFQLKL
jgi:hypothetical protein